MTELSERQRKNIETTREAFEAFRAGDMERVLAMADPEVEVYLPPSLPNSGTFRGHEGYLTWLKQWLEAWEDFAIEVTAQEPVGERHVVTSVHQSGVGRGSGIPVEMDVAYVCEIRDGRFAALQLYMSQEEAREVAEGREAEPPQ